VYYKKVTVSTIILILSLYFSANFAVAIHPPLSTNMNINDSTSRNSGISIIVGDDIDYPPFSYVDKHGIPTGFNIELIQAIGKVMGLEIEIRLQNWNDTMSDLRAGNIDVISGMYYSEERENEFNFSINHTASSSDIFTRNDFDITTLEDLAETNVVVLSNDINHEYLLKTHPEINLIEAPTIAHALRLISSGEYDYAAVSKLSGHYVINEHNLSNLKSNGLIINPRHYSMAVKRGNDELLNILNEGLVILNSTGQYKEIYNKWLGIYEENLLLSFMRKYAWIIYATLALLFILFVLVVVLKKLVTKRTIELLKLNSTLQESQEELTAANEELEASLGQLLTTEEQLRGQYNLLKESEERYKKLVTEMHQGLALHRIVLNENNEVVDYIFVDVNQSFEKLTGLSRNDLIGKSVTEVFPSNGTYWVKKFGEVALTGNVIHLEKYNEDLNKYFDIVVYRPRPMNFAVILTDITERKISEELLKTSEQNFRMLFEGSSDPIFLMDDQKLIDCNSATVEIFGYNYKHELLGKSPWNLSPVKQLDGELSKTKAAEIINTAYRDGKYRFEWLHQKRDGTLLPMDIIITTISIENKKLLHVVCRDITEREQMMQKLEYLSYHDQLTGLYNRRFFENKLLEIDHPYSLPLTVVMADVNGLKLINDGFGHLVGDELLIKVSNVLRKGCRPSDIIARLGGDEFVILMPNTDVTMAEEVVKNIRHLAHNESIESIAISVSFGISTKFKDDQDIQEVLKFAEDDMYKKKLYESPSIRSKNISIIVKTLNEKCAREEEHSQRVSAICQSMGEALELSEEKVHELKTVGLLHDIGKIAIEGDILNKPGKLTDEEWQEIKRHPEIGYRLLSSVNEMSDIAEYVLAHHERWDGKGYPKGLKGTNIPLQARIISIADSYDAMTSQRSYRSNPLSHDEAINELIKHSGKQFDPELVKVFTEKVAIYN